MIGCTLPNNDIYVFFEDREIFEITEGKIQGIHINISQEQSVLEVLVDDEACQKACEIVLIDNSSGEYNLSIRTEVMRKLQERGSYEDHKGYLHVCLRNVDKMGFELYCI